MKETETIKIDANALGIEIPLFPPREISVKGLGKDGKPFYGKDGQRAEWKIKISHHGKAQMT